MRKLATPVTLVLVVTLAAACGSSAHPSAHVSLSPSHDPGSTTTTTARAPQPAVSPKQAALELARRMVSEAVLPPGAQPSSAPLPSLLRGPFQTPAGGNVVGANRLWTVAEDPSVVIEFLTSHAPAGFAQSGVGSSGSPTEHAQDVIQQLRIVPANVYEAGLEIGVEADPAGGSLVNVYGGVQWTALRPADELVPATDHAVIVSVVRIFQPGKPIARRVVVTDPAKVAAIAHAFDALSVAPRGEVFNCYMLSSNAVSYRIAFATSSTAKPDLVATAAACSTTAVTVDGHARPALSASLGAFGTAVARALGKATLKFE